MRMVLLLCGILALLPGKDAFCAPDLRTVFVAVFFSSSGNAAASPLQERILMLFRGEKRLTLLNDLPGAAASGLSLTGLSSDESLRRLCERTGAAWVLFGVIGADSASCRVCMYDYSRGMIHLFHEEASSSEKLAAAFAPDLERIFFLISSADAFFLHSPSPLVYVRDIADYGFTGDRLGLNYPGGLFVTKKNTLLCAASGTVVEWDREGRTIGHYGKRGSGAGEYTSSMKAAADDDGNVYVSDMSGKVIVYPVKGKPSEMIFERVPSFVAVSASGTIFVGDKTGGNIKLYDKKGYAIGDIPMSGDTVYAAARCGENVLFLVSSGQKIILRSFSPSGKPLSETVLPLKEDDVVVSAFCADAGGNIYILDMGSRAVVKVTRDGKIPWVSPFAWAGPLGQIGNPFDIAVSADGTRVYVADSSNRRVVVMGEFRETLAASVQESDGIGDSDRKLASLGEILRKDPMNASAVGRYIDFYESKEAYRQALELCRKYSASLPAVQKRIAALSSAAWLRDADGFAGLFEAAVLSKDAASADFYFDESAALYDRAFSASGDRTAKEKKDRLVKRRSELQKPMKNGGGKGRQ